MAEHKNFQPTDPDGYQKYPNYFKPFRFFCQHVLPLVYDDSLSYYELLCKVIHKLNEVTESVNMLIDDYKALEEAFEELIKYVDDYFNELVDEMNELKEQWTEFKAEIEKEMADFKAQIEAVQEEFEEKITSQQNNFEAKITEEQENFENEITTQQNNFESNLTNEWNTYKTNLNNEWSTYQTNLNTQFQDMLDKTQEAIDTLNEAVEALPDTVKTEVDKQLAEKLPEIQSELETYCLNYLKALPAVKYYPTNAEAISDVTNLSEGDIIVVGRQSTSTYAANGGVYRIRAHEDTDPELNTSDRFDVVYNVAFALSDELTAVNIRFNYNYGEPSANGNVFPQSLSNNTIKVLYNRVLRNYNAGNTFPSPIYITISDLNSITIDEGVTNPFPEELNGKAVLCGVIGYYNSVNNPYVYLQGIMVVYDDSVNPSDVQLYSVILKIKSDGTNYNLTLTSAVGLTYVTPNSLEDRLDNYYTESEINEKLSDVTTSSQNVFCVDTELTYSTLAEAIVTKWNECYSQLNSSFDFIVIFINNEEIEFPESDEYASFSADTFVFYGTNSTELTGIAYARDTSNYNLYPFYCDGDSISSKWEGLQVLSERITSLDDTTSPATVGRILSQRLIGFNRIVHVYCDKVCKVTGTSAGAGEEFVANTFIGFLSSNSLIRGFAMLSPAGRSAGTYYTSMVYPFIVGYDDDTVYSTFSRDYYTKTEINEKVDTLNDSISAITTSNQNVFVDDCTATTNAELGKSIYNAYNNYTEQTNGQNFVLILNCTNEITVPAGERSADSFIANKFIITYDGAISSSNEVSGIAYRLSDNNDGTERCNAFYCDVSSESNAIPYSCTSIGYNNIIEVEFDKYSDFSLQEIANAFPNATIQKGYLVHVHFNNTSILSPYNANCKDNRMTDALLSYTGELLCGVCYYNSALGMLYGHQDFGTVLISGTYTVGSYSGTLYSTTQDRDYILSSLQISIDSTPTTMTEIINEMYNSITSPSSYGKLNARYAFATPYISDIDTDSVQCMVTINKISGIYFKGEIIPMDSSLNYTYHWRSFSDTGTFEDNLTIVKYTGDIV